MKDKPSSTQFTSRLAPTIARYLSLKRALGRRADTIEYQLRRLDRFLASHNFTELTRETFAAWCQSLQPLKPNTRRHWMRTVYLFCVFRQRDDHACFVPDPSQFPPFCPRPLPHIFSAAEVTRLLVTADTFVPHVASPLYPQVARLGVVLLYTAGLRRGEVVRLTLADYEPTERVLLIRETKFHKSRIVPLSGDATAEVDRYLSLRRQRFPSHPGAPLLVHNHGGRIGPYTGEGFGHAMRTLFRTADIRTARGRSPRVHDLRFTFAAHALLRRYHAGVDVQTRLPALAAYMGHASVLSTQYYLKFCRATAEAANELYHVHCAGFLLKGCAGGGQ